MKLSLCIFQHIAYRGKFSSSFNFEDLKYNYSSEDVFASNLTFTLNDFYTVFHCENFFTS
jgi:hypothetical protein